MNELRGTLAACPACSALPDIKEKATRQNTESLVLSVPDMHCAACLSKVENALNTDPRVRNARANLSLHRVNIETYAQADAEEFLPILNSLGYAAYPWDQEMVSQAQDETARGYLLRLGVAGFAMMNVMLLSISVWTGADASTRDLLHWVSAMIAIPAILYAATPFFRSALQALRHGQLNMDVPISLAIILAMLISVYEVSQSRDQVYFDAALSLSFFLLVGRYLDYRTRRMARSAAQELAALESKKAIRIGEDGDETVNITELRRGDVLRILPGVRIPADGVILDGESDLDTALVSGESTPALIKAGDDVRAGMLNLTGMMQMRAEKVGEDTSLHQMTRLVEIAENGRNRYTSLADRAAKIYAPLVHFLALVAFCAWMYIGGDWEFALGVSIAVLVITCPCALGLAVPAVSTAASGRLFTRSVLLKSETALERLADIDVVVFDKTGTLTRGEPEVVEIEGGNLDLAMGLAQSSAHPLSVALVKALELRDIKPVKLDHAKELAGCGIQGEFEGKKVRLGRPEWVGLQSKSALSEVILEYNGAFTRFKFHDQIRDGAKEAIEEFQKQGIRCVLLSGDRLEVVRETANRLRLDEYQASISPEGKASYISTLKSQGHKPLMIGDGLNDTIALAEAHVSIAPGQAVEVARITSDIVILGDSLEVIAESFSVSKSAKARIIENFSLAAGYNCIAIPFAFLGFATPFLAALAMSTSSILVVLNSNRVRWKK